MAVAKPVFILGIPRSGTTFLHRTLSEDRETFTAISTWEAVLAPSITARKFWRGIATLDRLIGGPLAKLLTLLETRLFKALEGIHTVSLEAAEEDYLLLLPIFSCFILFLPFTESRHIWQLSRFDWEVPDADKQIIIGFYKSCLQKHMYVHGPNKRYLSKNAAFASWPISLHETFPDADFVVCMREPAEAIPSLLGSLKSGASLFELDLQQGKLPVLITEMMQEYYRHLLTNFPTDGPIVHMDSLKHNLISTVESLYTYFDLNIQADYRKRLIALDTDARAYRTLTHAIDPAPPENHSFYETEFHWYYELFRSGHKALPKN